MGVLSITNQKRPKKQGKSNIIQLYADNSASRLTSAHPEIPTRAHDGPLVVPHTDREKRTMAAIESRLYRHPAVAEVEAFRYQTRKGTIRFGAAILLYDWDETITAAEITNWIAKHLDPHSLPVRVVWLTPD